MADYLQGALGTLQGGVEATNDITVCIRNWFPNRNPLYTRLPTKPVGRVDYLLYTHPYRAGSTTITTALSATTTTGLVLADATFLQNHDVLELVDSVSGYAERVWINGDPTSATNVTVVRGVSGTTATATITAASTVNVIGSARTGNEVNQTALTTIGTPRTQYCQTFQYGVQVGGSAETTKNVVLPGGIQSPFDFNMTMNLQNMVDDIERTFYYGIAQAPVDSTVSAKMDGVRAQIQTYAANYTNTPTNASAYGSTDMIRDLLQKARAGGGDPDMLLVSTEFMPGFATWGQALMRLDAGATLFGTPIKMFAAPFLNDVIVIEAPLLRPYTAAAFTSAEIYMRPKRNVFFSPRGIRGDMKEGDWIAETSIELINPAHHAWVEGITTFSAN